MDVTTARQAARVRSLVSLGAAALCALLAVGCVLSAWSAPDEVRPLLAGATVLAVVAAVACLWVAGANRALHREPTAREPRTQVGVALLVTVLTWLVVVAGVTLATGEVAWFIASLGLASLLLPVAAVAGVTLKGPHPQ